MREFYLKKFGKIFIKEENNIIKIYFTLSNGIRGSLSFNPTRGNTCAEEIENMTSEKLDKILTYNN